MNDGDKVLRSVYLLYINMLLSIKLFAMRYTYTRQVSIICAFLCKFFFNAQHFSINLSHKNYLVRSDVGKINK